MSKIWAGILALLLCTSFVGCSSGKTMTSSSSATSSVITESSGQSPVSSTSKDLPDSNYKDIGKGTFEISTPGGTSENGKTPAIFLDSGKLYNYEIGVHVRDFDGSKLSYVYIDGYLTSKEQYADEDSSIIAKSDRLTVGKHKVEVVQYETDKPNGKMVTYKSASYEVKSK